MGFSPGILNGQTHMKETRLFIGNLSYNTTEDDLRSLFAEAGNVASVNLMMDKFTGKSRGFAFVEMGTPAEAAKAIELFHGKDLQQRALTVNIARPREDRPPGRGGPREDRGPRGGGGRESSHGSRY
jgi:RNA recognition motif-containing protein